MSLADFPSQISPSTSQAGKIPFPEVPAPARGPQPAPHTRVRSLTALRCSIPIHCTYSECAAAFSRRGASPARVCGGRPQ